MKSPRLEFASLQFFELSWIIDDSLIFRGGKEVKSVHELAPIANLEHRSIRQQVLKR
jgi:hypothetical protein